MPGHRPRNASRANGAADLNGTVATAAAIDPATPVWVVAVAGTFVPANIPPNVTTPPYSWGVIVYNAQNEIGTIGSASLAYDANGNLTTDEQGNTLTHDAWNHLVRVTASARFTQSAESQCTLSSTPPSRIRPS